MTSLKKTTTNEGILFWYHAKQDRTYYLDMASGDDYTTVVRETLGNYQQSFRVWTPRYIEALFFVVTGTIIPFSTHHEIRVVR